MYIILSKPNKHLITLWILPLQKKTSPIFPLPSRVASIFPLDLRTSTPFKVLRVRFAPIKILATKKNPVLDMINPVFLRKVTLNSFQCQNPGFFNGFTVSPLFHRFPPVMFYFSAWPLFSKKYLAAWPRVETHCVFWYKKLWKIFGWTFRISKWNMKIFGSTICNIKKYGTKMVKTFGTI